MKVPQSIEELLQLVEQQGADAVARRFRKPPIPSKLLIALSESSPPEDGWVFLTSYSLTPSSLLEEIGANCTDYPSSVLVPLTQNPRTPPSTLSVLLRHDDPQVKAAAGRNPNLPARDIETLLGEDHPEVWRALASNTSLKFRTQAILAARGDASVRLELVNNKSLHPDLMVALSADPSPLVRHALATLPKVDDEMLLFWADSDREEIQHAILSRDDLPKEVWRSLMLSPHASVRKAVREGRKLDKVDLLHLSRSEDVEDREFVARRKNVTPGIQHELAHDRSTAVRVALAENRSIEPEVAEFLVTGEDVEACLALLENPDMPPGLFLELAWMNQPSVTAALARNRKTPEEVLQYLTNEKLSAVALAYLAISRRPATWLRSELAHALARHELPSIRALAASSLHLSERARNRLRDDPCPRVSKMALAYPAEENPTTAPMPAHALENCLKELAAIIDGAYSIAPIPVKGREPEDPSEDALTEPLETETSE
ncbi:MAG: hypothetical protein ACQKBT_09790 [Puniceicoccales bacterium]